MMLRMSDAQGPASEHARAMAQARWGNQVLTRAVGVVVERAADLDEPLREQLQAAIGEHGDDSGE